MSQSIIQSTMPCTEMHDMVFVSHDTGEEIHKAAGMINNQYSKTEMTWRHQRKIRQ